jgi:hypothetical protein
MLMLSRSTLFLIAPAATFALDTGSSLVWPPEHPDWAEWPMVETGETTCFRGTSCAAHYSSNRMGCCPYEGAVCCPNGQTCCPTGTTCSDSGTYLTTCMKGTAKVGAGLSVCKPGAAAPMSKTLPNVLIIGDSVSIGYTPKVAAHMANIALVQHSPLDGGDGGAEETAYGVQCLDYFLRSPTGELLKPDVIMFNWVSAVPSSALAGHTAGCALGVAKVRSATMAGPPRWTARQRNGRWTVKMCTHA